MYKVNLLSIIKLSQKWNYFLFFGRFINTEINTKKEWKQVENGFPFIFNQVGESNRHATCYIV